MRRQEIEKLIDEGRYEESLDLLNTLNNPLVTSYIESRIQREQGNFKLALEKISKAYNQRATINDLNLKLQVMSEQSYVYYHLGEFEKSKEIIEDGLNYYNSIVDKDGKIAIAKLYNILGNINFRKGEHANALENYQASLKIRQEFNEVKEIATSLNNIGTVYHSKGDLDKALEYYFKSLDFKEELDNKVDIAYTIHNIAMIYQLKGELGKAQSRLSEILENRYEIGNNEIISSVQLNLGKIWQDRGDLDKALKFYEESYEIRKSLNNTMALASPLMNIFLVHMLTNNREQAEKYLDILKKITEDVDNRHIEVRHKLCHALLNKSSKRLKSKVSAEIELKEIINQNIVDIDITILAMKHLTELLLSELKMYGENEVFDEIEELISQMYKLAQQQNMYPLLVHTLILKSRFVSVRGDFQEANQILEQANLLAIEKKLARLQNEVDREINRFKKEITKLKEMIENNSEFVDRIEKSRLMEYIKIIQEKSI